MIDKKVVSSQFLGERKTSDELKARCAKRGGIGRGKEEAKLQQGMRERSVNVALSAHDREVFSKKQAKTEEPIQGAVPQEAANRTS